MKADGSDVGRLTTDEAMDWRPSWSPDGARIAFESYRNGEADVFSMGADGTDVKRLTTSPSSRPRSS